MKFISTLTLVLFAFLAHGQEYKISKSSGRLELKIGRVTVEGYSGNEIIFSGRDRDKKDDERSKGLKEISGLGIEDNTGLGINVEENGGTIVVRQLRKMNSPDIRIQVPKGVTVAYSFESQYGGDVVFRNLESEIEFSSNYNSLEMINVTGPATVKTIYGHVEATFDQNVKGPLSIVSVYGYADVALPSTIKANLRLSTSYGELYASPDFKIEMDRSQEDENRVIGKINGGGMAVDISSNYGKVYLRKK
jgi:Putative adhesin